MKSLGPIHTILSPSRVLWLVVALATTLPALPSAGKAPPIPVYDGCVVKDQIRIVTGLKRVVRQVEGQEQPVDLGAYDGKRVRFKGYLKAEPILVTVQDALEVIGPCRGAQTLPDLGVSVEEALRRSEELPVSKATEAKGVPMAAVVEAISPPMMSGLLDGREILSGRFKVVEALGGQWPAEFKLLYSASVDANERAVRKGETVLVIPTHRKADETFSAGAILPDTDESRRAVKAAK